jgi:hypothetical protein
VVFASDTFTLRGDGNEKIDKSYCSRRMPSSLPYPYWIVEETLYQTQHTVLINQETRVKTTLNGNMDILPGGALLLESYASLVYDDEVSTL